MTTLNLKAVASAFAALVVTAAFTLSFIDATSIARIHRDSGSGFLANVSALVR